MEGSNQIVLNEITIHLNEKAVNVNDKRLTLTKKEYDLLFYLIANKGRALTKQAIVKHLWEEEHEFIDSFDVLYTHIKNLRKKLIKSGCRDYIKTIYGIGYNFNPE